MPKIKRGSSYEAFEQVIKMALQSALMFYEISYDNKRAKDIIDKVAKDIIDEYFI